MDEIDDKVRKGLPIDPSWTDKEKEEYLFLKTLTESQRSKVLGEKLDFLKEVERQSERSEGKRPVKMWYWVAVAASILLIVFIYFPRANNPSFTDHFEIYPDLELTRSVESDAGHQDAFTYYNNAEYGPAMESMVKLYEETKAEKYLFYAGNAALANQEYTLALEYFQQIPLTDEWTSEYPYYYYLGLTYLSLGRSEEAMQALKKQKSSSSYYNDRAALLLQELDSSQ